MKFIRIAILILSLSALNSCQKLFKMWGENVSCDAKDVGITYLINDTQSDIVMKRTLIRGLNWIQSETLSPNDTLQISMDKWDKDEYYPSFQQRNGGFNYIIRIANGCYQEEIYEIDILLSSSDGTILKEWSSFDTDDKSSIFLESNWDPEVITYGGECGDNCTRKEKDHVFHRWYYHFTGIQ